MQCPHAQHCSGASGTAGDACPSEQTPYEEPRPLLHRAPARPGAQIAGNGSVLWQPPLQVGGATAGVGCSGSQGAREGAPQGAGWKLQTSGTPRRASQLFGSGTTRKARQPFGAPEMLTDLPGCKSIGSVSFESRTSISSQKGLRAPVERGPWGIRPNAARCANRLALSARSRNEVGSRRPSCGNRPRRQCAQKRHRPEG